ncbi:MAG: glutathione S-transferase family protein [Geminicoccaceae bacterium]
MITVFGFGKVFRPVIGETRDLRVEWALEEMRLPYRVQGLDHMGGEHKEAAYSRISPFHLVPAIDDEGLTVAESGAVLLYLAEKSGKLIPSDLEGRSRVIQWCFAALNTIERPMLEIQLIDKFGDGGEAASTRRAAMVKEAGRWFAGLERQLEDRA